MKFHFYKYHGTGNDFILIDNRDKKVSLTTEQVAHLCNRRFGIGADGLMLLEKATGFDFKMVYYNSDGNESTMCGNGGRCITAFAKKLGIVTVEAKFTAIDGSHESMVLPSGLICLQMQDVNDIQIFHDHTVLNTGSPHYIQWVADVHNTDVVEEGRAIRNMDAFKPKGINVNFVEPLNEGLWVRTYERGVEDETYSCGTGVVAAAIADSDKATGNFTTAIQTIGGPLEVRFKKDTSLTAKDILLIGPAKFVFEGDTEI